MPTHRASRVPSAPLEPKAEAIEVGRKPVAHRTERTVEAIRASMAGL